jgi:hypothetical protein
VYSTCSAAKKQNEDIVRWLLAQESAAELLPLPRVPQGKDASPFDCLQVFCIEACFEPLRSRSVSVLALLLLYLCCICIYSSLSHQLVASIIRLHLLHVLCIASVTLSGLRGTAACER